MCAKAGLLTKIPNVNPTIVVNAKPNNNPAPALINTIIATIVVN